MGKEPSDEVSKKMGVEVVWKDKQVLRNYYHTSLKNKGVAQSPPIDLLNVKRFKLEDGGKWRRNYW